ncbi:lysozyme [Anaerosolibacter carboniphilus]|uniref:Lysozyme n=1 Tax=Anaerosolibacter carboniphilus TaxID=1417629 RepID=A0A841KVE8_9FIRM|nr:GH25 family lysozyme [Anaerosolibacter carboniphilus]MBB6217363.1 lysozyme [Anaerosolibacter carboniphilus]
MKKKHFKISIVTILAALAITALIYTGVIWPNSIFASKYPVHGIDISHHQNEIDWDKVKDENIKFVFIKATEGKDFKDRLFEENWVKTKEAGLIRGAYHFFTFGSAGSDQATNFIRSVPIEDKVLPPVIDLEFDGNSKSVPSPEVVKKELRNFIHSIEEHYKQEPILYLTYDSYSQFIKGDFLEYPIWIRDIVKQPSFKNGREWLFWQYSNRGKIDGIEGYVDVNVFHSDLTELEKLLSPNKD